MRRAAEDLRRHPVDAVMTGLARASISTCVAPVLGSVCVSTRTRSFREEVDLAECERRPRDVAGHALEFL